jgi:hypothetical protein
VIINKQKLDSEVRNEVILKNRNKVLQRGSKWYRINRNRIVQRGGFRITFMQKRKKWYFIKGKLIMQNEGSDT